MKLENIKLDNLKLLEKNVREHSSKQIEELIRSLKQFGQTRAMVIDEDNNILIGNGLYMALKEMGETTAYCYRKTGLNEIQKKKLVLSDNKIYDLGTDDFDILNEYINDIAGTGDYDIAGFDEEIIQELTRTIDEADDEIKNMGIITDKNLVVNNNTTSNEVKEEENTKVAKIITEREISTEPTEKKYIICPACGEVIYLD